MNRWLAQLWSSKTQPVARPRRVPLHLERLEDRVTPATITEFAIPTTSANVQSIVAGADGNLWFTEFGNNAIGRITPTGVVAEFPLTALGYDQGPYDLVSGPGGKIYFTEYFGGQIGSINPLAGSDALILASETQSAVVPSGFGTVVLGITVGPDGNLWFTEPNNDQIGNVDPSLTTIHEFSTGITAGASPENIVAGPDGALWFTESGFNSNAGAIGRITTAGVVTNEFPLAGTDNAPFDITVGPEGKDLWFTNSDSGQIGRLTLSTDTITTFPLLPQSDPQGITTGPDGNLYFVENTANQIGRITTAGVVTEYSNGITPGSGLADITVGPDGNLWFTESNNTATDGIGRLVPDAPLGARFPLGFGAGTNGVESVVNLQANGQVLASPTPIPGWTGEVHRATGIFDGTVGTVDTVWAAGPGGGPRVRIINAAGAVIADFYAFDPSFTGGVNVAVGDVNHDGTPDLIVSAGPGGGPEVKVIDGTLLNLKGSNGEIAPAALLADFYAYAPGFTGGVAVAAGDVNDDGYADIITGAGPGGGPEVKVIDGAKAGQILPNGEISDAALLADFYAFAPGFTGGVNVASGDFNNDGYADVLVGAGAGGGPEVKMIDGMRLNQNQSNGEIAGNALFADFYAYAPSFHGGVRVDAVEVNGDGKADIVTGAGQGGGPEVKVFRATDLAVLDDFYAQSPTFPGGVFV